MAEKTQEAQKKLEEAVEKLKSIQQRMSPLFNEQHWCDGGINQRSSCCASSCSGIARDVRIFVTEELEKVIASLSEEA
jgi:hypothetical protein